MMSRYHLLPLTLLAVSACSTREPAPAPSPAPPTTTQTGGDAVNYTAIERELMHRVNLERAKIRLDTLRWNAQLDKAAHVQAVQMAAEGKMAHDLAGAQYPTLRDRVRYSGYSYRHLAENIAYRYPGAAATVAAWMASPVHRANILDRVSYETGVGVARAKTGELYYCQVFGARLYDLP